MLFALIKMEEFWILILVAFFAANSLDKAEAVKMELKTFFGEGWWDNDKADEWDKLTLEQNFHCQIDQQNANHGQIEPNSTDQNPPITESDKRKIIDKFLAIKDEFKKKGKFSTKEWVQIEDKIAKHLKANRSKIYKWKKEFGLSQKVAYEKEERKHLVEKFDQMKAELKRDGFKKSYREINETVAKELGLTFITIYKWKSELGQTKPNHKHTHSEQKELMKRYYEIKNENPKISDADNAKMLNIGRVTLVNWKKLGARIRGVFE